jgi:hypothetical protein
MKPQRLGRRAWGAALSLTVLGAATTACDEGVDCTLIGCGIDGLVIDLTGPDGDDLPDGAYVVSATDGAETLRCEFDVPAGQAEPTCYVAELQGFGGDVTFYGSAPATTTITVTRDGVTVGGADAVAVDYDVTYPNGPDCDPGCRSGLVVVEVD